MANNEKDYKEERFEFAVFVDDKLIAKRNFRIYNYIENSMNTLDFKETLDGIVRLIDEDLKAKSRVYTWYHFNPEQPDADEEFNNPLIEPWQCTFKIVVYDNKREVISRIWDGYAYPRYVRDWVDLSNKYVRVTNKDGQTFTYHKDTFFESNKGRLQFEYEVLKSMIYDKSDVLLKVTRRICEACSPSKDEIYSRDGGRFDYRDSSKYLANYVQSVEYGDKSYPFSLKLTNRAYEKAWERATMNKTRKYYRNFPA